MPSSTEISVSRLAGLIGTPDAPTVVDVRIDADVAADPRIVPTARRHPFADMETLARSLAGARVAVACQKGEKLSQGAAAILRDFGVAADSVEGGMFAWRDAGLPLTPVAALPERAATGRTIWTTARAPDLDVLACCWLLRRFVDPRAQILFVAPDQVLAVAEKFAATPFGVDGAAPRRRGFRAMTEAWALATPPLRRLATVLQDAPETPGLAVVAQGLERLHQDDLATVDGAIALFDAVYHWARDAASAA